MPRSVTSRKGWPGCTLEGVGGWILGHQAKLSDLLIKEKQWLVILFAPVEREDGRIRVKVLCHPVPGQRVMWGLGGRVHSVRLAMMDMGTLDPCSTAAATLSNNPILSWKIKAKKSLTIEH